MKDVLASVLAATGRPSSPGDVRAIPTANRVEAVLRGLGSSVPEAAALREYLFSQGGYVRLNHFRDVFIGTGRALDAVKPRDAAAYDHVCRFAWDQGIHLGVLRVIGEI
jgi:hypothetical protein